MAQEIEHIDKEGVLRKRSGRYHSWSSRYFILSGPKLAYKIKNDSSTFKGTFDLVPGCMLTDIMEETVGVRKKIYVFWLLWPHDKTKTDDTKGEDDEEEEHDEETNGKPKDLKEIVCSERKQHERQQHQAEKQLEQHQAHDKNVGMSIRYGALAVAGGVVVGALTAGIGLVPYLTAVGVAVVAVGGGAAAIRYRKPSDSRLIMACETQSEVSGHHLKWLPFCALSLSPFRLLSSRQLRGRSRLRHRSLDWT